MDQGHESWRERHVARFSELLPEYQARIDWPAGQLARERIRSLRALIGVAREHSPWHREWLRDVDPQLLTDADLTHLPVMTKDES